MERRLLQECLKWTKIFIGFGLFPERNVWNLLSNCDWHGRPSKQQTSKSSTPIGTNKKENPIIII